MSKQIWLHSDWHRHHENMYRFVYTDGAGVERRVRERFGSAAEGDAYIEQRIHDLVKEDHSIYFLGDLTLHRDNHMAHEFVQFFKSLPGTKYLAPGNHDHLKPRHYVDAGFRRMRGAYLVDGLLLSHYPVHQGSIGFRAKGNAHGHTHQQPDIWPYHRPDGTVAAWLNVCVERTGYEPIPIEEAARLLEACRNAPPRQP